MPTTDAADATTFLVALRQSTAARRWFAAEGSASRRPGARNSPRWTEASCGANRLWLGLPLPPVRLLSSASAPPSWTPAERSPAKSGCRCQRCRSAALSTRAAAARPAALKRPLDPAALFAANLVGRALRDPMGPAWSIEPAPPVSVPAASPPPLYFGSTFLAGTTPRPQTSSLAVRRHRPPHVRGLESRQRIGSGPGERAPRRRRLAQLGSWGRRR